MLTDSFTDALDRLDPADRALLDLSLRRGMRTEEIADVLGAEPESVEASRDEALRRIASDVGMSGDDDLDEVRNRLAQLPPSDWLGNGSAAGAGGEAEAEAEAPRRRGSLRPLLLGLVLTAAVVVAIAVATSDSGDDGAPSQSGSSNVQTPPPANGGPAAARLSAVGASGASGTARVSDGRLTLRASGLQTGGSYEVWLYNSILDARSLGTAKGAAFSVSADLPGSWRRFRFVDVSRERADGNLSHSGESVLRVPTRTLARR